VVATPRRSRPAHCRFRLMGRAARGTLSLSLFHARRERARALAPGRSLTLGELAQRAGERGGALGTVRGRVLDMLRR